jgi:hypothetical protein
VTNTAQDLNRILFNLHASAATVAPLSTLQLMIYLLNRYGHAGRQTFNCRDKRASV